MPDRPLRAAPPRRSARLAVGVALDGVRAQVPRGSLERLAEYVLRAEKVRDALLSITLVSARAMARLNRVYIGRTGSTDVIAFGLGDPGAPARGAVLGDVYIAPAVAAANARRYGVTLRHELERLAVHGTLHVLGWDHANGPERERSPMWARQERLLRAWRRRGSSR